MTRTSGTGLRRSPVRCSNGARPSRGRLSSRSGSDGSGSKPHAASSLTSCSSVRKHCGWPENCVNTKDSPGSGSAVFGKRAAREREQEQRTSGSRHARGLSDRLPELTAGTREVPDPVRDDEVEDSRREGQLVHRRPQQAHTIRELQHPPHARQPPSASVTRGRCPPPPSQRGPAAMRCDRRRTRCRATARTRATLVRRSAARCRSAATARSLQPCSAGSRANHSSGCDHQRARRSHRMSSSGCECSAATRVALSMNSEASNRMRCELFG